MCHDFSRRSTKQPIAQHHAQKRSELLGFWKVKNIVG